MTRGRALAAARIKVTILANAPTGAGAARDDHPSDDAAGPPRPGGRTGGAALNGWGRPVLAGDALGALRLFRGAVPSFPVSVDGREVGAFFRLGRGRFVSVDARTGSVTPAPDQARALGALHQGERFAMSRSTLDVLALCAVERGRDPDASVPFLAAHSFPVDCGGWSGHAVLGMSDHVTVHGTEAEAVEATLPEVLWRAGWSEGDVPGIDGERLRRIMSGVPRLLAAA